ncbi:nuclear transport factor 2 family protein [Nostoc sp.]
MRQPAIAFTTLLATTLAMTNVVYANEQADKQAIIESYRTLDAGIQRKNLNQAVSVYAPEFTQVEMDGKVRNLEQIRKDWQQNVPNIRQIQVMREQRIKINGQTATVVGTGYQSAIFSNPNNPQVPIPVSTVFQYQDTWKRTNSGWKATNARILQSNTASGQ